MATLSELFSHLQTMTHVFFTILFLELVILIRSVTGDAAASAPKRRRITPTQFLEIIEQKFPAGKWASPEPADCAVCLTEFNDGERVRRLPCRHVFHTDCLDRWLQQCWTTCPLCRNRVLPENVVSGYREVQNEVDYYDGSDEELMLLLSALHGNSLHRFL